jgi:molybdopterin molybdotransferase
MPDLKQLPAAIPGYDPESMPLDAALAAIRSPLQAVDGIETVALRNALDRVVAADVISPIDVPAHDNSAMDGYALRGADLREDAESRLSLVGTSLAGHPFDGALRAGQCVRIMTGAMMPSGADTVVMQEVTSHANERVIIPAGQKPGGNRRLAGEDLARGSVALAAGTRVRAADLGLLASLGLQTVQVRRRLKVAFFSTGDELGTSGDSLAPGQVYDSNRESLHGMLTRLNCEAIDLGIVRDDPAALELAFRKGVMAADVVISSGGVSVGDADYIRPMMERLGEVLFWKLALRPGRPMAFGRLDNAGRHALLFALPGNPVATMVTFYLLVRPALLALMGRTDTDLPMLPALAQEPMSKRPGRTEVLRGVVELRDGEWRVRTTGAQGSGMLSSMSQANCLIVLDHERDEVKAGERVEVLLFEGLV